MPDYEKAARRAARRHGIDPDVFVAQLRQESGLRMGLTSSAGARDIAQFIPSTAKQYGVTLGDNRAADDLDGAARYMRDNLKRTGGDYKAALSIYNSGRPDAYKDPGFAGGQTYNYVRSIMSAAGPAKKLKRPARGQPSSMTVTEGAVDNSALRKQLVGQFLQSGGVANPNAVLALAGSYGQAADVPGTPVTYENQQPSRSTGGSRSRSEHGPIGGQLFESFYNGPGGVNIDNGQRVPKGFVSGHKDHVHVAAGPRTTVSLGRLAESMGLTVRENPAFDPVDPVHTEGSFHYRNQAIDVSGDPAKMAAFSRRVARLMRV